MATTEYLKGADQHSGGELPHRQRWRGRSIAGVSLAAPGLRMLNDAVLISLSALVAIPVRLVLLHNLRGYWGTGTGITSLGMGFAYLGWFTVCYLLAAHRYGLYALVPLRNGAHETRLIVQSALTAALFLCGVLYITRDVASSRLLVLVFVLAVAVVLSIRRAVWRRARYRDYERGIELRNVLVLGTDRLSAAVGDLMVRRAHMGYHLCGYLALPTSGDDHEVPREGIVGGLADLRQLVRGRFVDELVIAQSCPTEIAIRLVEEARELDLDVSAITGYFPDLSANAPQEHIDCYPVVMLHRRERRSLALFFKRVADVILSLIAIIVASPVMAVTALAILMEGQGPILYVSQRVGKRGRSFPCFKFRTMVPDAEARRREMEAMNERDGILFKVSNDPRITPLGRLLRKYSLDELPQFFNVLRGEMSIVGPRPPLASEVERYELEHLRRLEVLPGLTGLWQVQARQNSSFARYIALDTAYVENWSFWLDLTILIRTLGVVLRGTGS